jgi:hypothetical protein
MEMTTQKRGFRDPMEFVRGTSDTAESAVEEVPARPVFPRRDAKQTVNLRMPKDLYDEMRDFWRMTDIPMTEVMVAGTRAELARLKKLHKID